jgi:hypothetical protein
MTKDIPPELLNEPVSIDNPAFHTYVTQALREGHTVVMLRRYAYRGGDRDYFLVRTIEDFQQVLSSSRIETLSSTSVFFATLPLRGKVDAAIETQIVEYLNALPASDKEVFIIRLDAANTLLDSDEDIFVFMTEAEVQDWCRANAGVSIIAGGLPFWEKNSERVITVYDGPPATY